MIFTTSLYISIHLLGNTMTQILMAADSGFYLSNKNKTPIELQSENFKSL